MGHLRWLLKTSRQLFLQLVKLVLLPLIAGCALEQWGGCLVAALTDDLDPGPFHLAPAAVWPEQVSLPLKTRGKRIVDSNNNTVRLRCVNWYGAHMQDMVVGGLHRQSLQSLVTSIQALGFNCVRLPYSLEMHLDKADTRPKVNVLEANPQFLNMSVMQIFDATIHALAEARIMVILNNHQGKAMWCCSEDDGEGLWYSQEYSEADWLRSLQMLARQYRQQPYVIGYDLRNEPRGIPAQIARKLQLTPQGRYLWPQWTRVTERGAANWAAAALRAAGMVLEEDPDGLIIVEALDFATDLRGVKQRPLHTEPGLTNRVVYEVHDYCWYHTNFFRAWQLHWLSIGWLVLGLFDLRRGKSKVGSTDATHENPGTAAPGLAKKLIFLSLTAAVISHWMTSYSWFQSKLDQRWGYILHANEAPIWLGEFGTNGYWTTAVWWMEVGEVLWLRHLLRYMSEHDLGYAYWALNGDKKLGEDETFGLLKQDYVSIRHPWLMKLLS